MDHAGDITWHLAPALQTAGFPVFEDPDTRTRKRRELIVQTRDSGEWYRITIEQIEPSEDDLYLPTYTQER